MIDFLLAGLFLIVAPGAARWVYAKGSQQDRLPSQVVGNIGNALATEKKMKSKNGFDACKAIVYCVKESNQLKAMKKLSGDIGSKSTILVNMDAEGKTVINQVRVDQIVNVSSVKFLDAQSAGYPPFPSEDIVACVTITVK